MEIRLQKIIAESGFCSRRKAEELIEEKRVRVNGRPASLGQKANPDWDTITIDGEKLNTKSRDKHVYYMMYKPRGYLTSMSDDRGRKCVSDLVAEIPERVFPVGRLDMNSEGLLLFTNDGDFANAMTHPSHQVPKTYRVTVHSQVEAEQMVRLSEGVELDGVLTNPADGSQIDDYQTSDGVHFTPSGYRAWAEYLATHTVWNRRSLYSGQNPYYIYGA